ncbi:MAG: MmcB family DNA repair protein [Pseudomonadota bacterium]
MPIISATQGPHPLIDGRQSERAMRVRRGIQIMMSEMGFAVLPELVLTTGRRADLVGLTSDGEIWIVEVKSSIEDMRTDSKWNEYCDYCDAFAFATLPDVPRDVFPSDEGFIVADAYGAEIVGSPKQHTLPAARRKAMLIRIAQAASRKLMAAEWAAIDI